MGIKTRSNPEGLIPISNKKRKMVDKKVEKEAEASNASASVESVAEASHERTVDTPTRPEVNSMQSVLAEVSIVSEEVIQLKETIKRLEKRIEELEEEKRAVVELVSKNGNDNESINSIHSNNSNSIQSNLSHSQNEIPLNSNFNQLPTPHQISYPYSNSNSSFMSSSSYPNTFETPYHQHLREHYPLQDNYILPTPISPTFSTLPPLLSPPPPPPPPPISYSNLNEEVFHPAPPPLPLLPPVSILPSNNPTQLSYSPISINSRNLATPYFYHPNRQIPQSQSISNSSNFYASNNNFDNSTPPVLSSNSSSTYSTNSILDPSPLIHQSSSSYESIPFPSIGRAYDLKFPSSGVDESLNGEGLRVEGSSRGIKGRRMSSEGWDEVWKVGAKLNEITAERDDSHEEVLKGRRM